jgi:hypothetical protein
MYYIWSHWLSIAQIHCGTAQRKRGRRSFKGIRITHSCIYFLQDYIGNALVNFKNPDIYFRKKYLRGLLIVTTLASFVGCFVLVEVCGDCAIMNVRDIGQKKGNGR